MLFNSPGFVFGFLPIALLVFHWLGARQRRLALAWLTLASLFFYGWWRPAGLPLLLASIAFNLLAAREIADKVAGRHTGPLARLSARQVLVLAIGADLALLFWFKYTALFVDTLAQAAGSGYRWAAGELPLGISFFTFTQIAFLVDVHQRRADDLDPLRYGLFVTYFPHLIAGPILHHKEMMPQFARPDIFRFEPARLADGLVIFILGLFKKTVLADAFGGYASPAFDAAGSHALTLFESWGAALSYTLQIYFDFSGYSDMAIGLALMIGVQLPMNFDSPYKARNIAEFWRRWHMTLSRFLRDYLYIPLGGNRRGLLRQQANLMITMLLGGLWHGAGWTFLVWGGLHGLYLTVFHAFRRAFPARLESGAASFRRSGWSVLSTTLSWSATFLAVVVAWVVFRAADLPAAWSMLRGMAGLNGAVLPDQIIGLVPALGQLADGAGKVRFLADGTVMGCVEMLVMIGFGLGIVLFGSTLPALRATWRYALVVPCAALALQKVLYGTSSQFLYFQF